MTETIIQSLPRTQRHPSTPGAALLSIIPMAAVSQEFRILLGVDPPTPSLKI